MRALNKHTMAVLRSTIGLTQKEMAALLGCSTITIQRIEGGTLKLSEALAERTQLETGVSLAWLLGEDIKQPIVGHSGAPGPYDREVFDAARAGLTGPIQQLENAGPQILFILTSLFAETLAVTLSSIKKNNYALCLYKLRKAMQLAIREFGIASEIADAFNGYAETQKNKSGRWSEGVVRVLCDEFENQLKQIVTAPLPPKRSSPPKPAARRKTRQ